MNENQVEIEKIETEIATAKRELDRKLYKRAALTGLLANPNFTNSSISEVVAQAAGYAEVCLMEDDNEWLPGETDEIEKEAESIVLSITNKLEDVA